MPIVPVTAEETHPLRLLVLRKNDPNALLAWPHDRDPASFHLAMDDDGERVAIASFYLEDHEDLFGDLQYHLRGMATRPDHQGQGNGAALLRHAIDHLRTLNADLLWCRARIEARGFYEKQGLIATGEPFEIVGVGMHYLMYLRL